MSFRADKLLNRWRDAPRKNPVFAAFDARTAQSAAEKKAHAGAARCVPSAGKRMLVGIHAPSVQTPSVLEPVEESNSADPPATLFNPVTRNCLVLGAELNGKSRAEKTDGCLRIDKNLMNRVIPSICFQKPSYTEAGISRTITGSYSIRSSCCQACLCAVQQRLFTRPG